MDLVINLDLSDISDIRIAFITTEDEEHTIEAVINLRDFKLETLVDNNVVVRSKQYESLTDMIEKALPNLDYDEWVSVSDEEFARVEAKPELLTPSFEKPKRTRIQTFDLHPDIPMSERNTFDLAHHEVEEVNKKS